MCTDSKSGLERSINYSPIGKFMIQAAAKNNIISNKGEQGVGRCRNPKQLSSAHSGASFEPKILAARFAAPNMIRYVYRKPKILFVGINPHFRSFERGVPFFK